MPRYNVEYNGNTTLRREFPDEYGDVKAASLTVYDRDGTALLTVIPVVAPTAPVASLVGTGYLNTAGAHSVKLAYVTNNGTTAMDGASNSVTVTGAGERIDLTGIPCSTSANVTARNIYMTKAAGSVYYYVTQIANNTATTYTGISVADASLTVEGPLVSHAATTVPQIGVAPPYAYTAVLTSATKVGEYKATLDAGLDAIYTGDLYRVGNDTSAQDTLRVESYDPSTRIVTFADYFRHAHAAGEYCKARFCTYELTTALTATWTANLELTLVWDFYSDGTGTTSPYLAVSDLGRVIKRVAGEGGLEAAFRVRYRQYAEMLQDVDFTTVSDDALNELRDLFDSKGLDVDKVVDSHSFYELRLVQIAYSLAFGLGADWESQRVALRDRRLELIGQIEKLSVWQDTDEDLVEDEAEVQTVDRPYPRRRLF